MFITFLKIKSDGQNKEINYPPQIFYHEEGEERRMEELELSCSIH